MEVCTSHLNLVHTREINLLHAFSSNFSIQSFKHEERMTLIHFKGQRSSLIGQIWKYVLHTLTLCTQEKLICYMHSHQTLVYSHLNMKRGWPLFIFMVKGEDPYWMNLKVCTSHLNLCTQEKLICYMHSHQTLVYSHLNMKRGWPLFIFIVKGQDPYWTNLKVCTSHLNLCTQEKLICYMHPH